MRELFTIDTQGWGADAGNNNFKLGDVDEKESQEFCESKSRYLLESKISKIDQKEITDITPEKYILVHLQIPRDYTIKYHSPITIKYFVDSLMAWAEENQTHICVKMHPNNRMDTDLHQAVDEGTQSEYVHKVEGNIHELIRRSIGVFVINSGTGFESLIHGKPVATFGACDYSKATLNADIRRLNEARDFLLDYKDEWRSIGYQFVYWYWTRHAYDVNRSDTKKRLMQYLKENL
jgi:capsule polysaccharide export protein KpsC/LpsZ